MWWYIYIYPGCSWVYGHVPSANCQTGSSLKLHPRAAEKGHVFCMTMSEEAKNLLSYNRKDEKLSQGKISFISDVVE